MFATKTYELKVLRFTNKVAGKAQYNKSAASYKVRMLAKFRVTASGGSSSVLHS